MHTFHTPQPVRLRVEVYEGRVDIVAAETDTTTVELIAADGDADIAQELMERATVEQHGNDIVVELPKSKSGLFRRGHRVLVHITVPLGSSAALETAAADVQTRGQLGDVVISSGSGDVDLELTVDLQARLGSGDLRLGAAHGAVDIKGGSSDLVLGDIADAVTILTGSGDVLLDRVGGTLKIKSGSGDVVLKEAGTGVDAMAGSGDVTLRQVAKGRVKAKTGSGDVSIAVTHGTAAYLDIASVSGDVYSKLDGSPAPHDGEPTVEIDVKTASGDVVLQRA